MGVKPPVTLEQVLKDIADIRYATITDLTDIVAVPAYAEIAATDLGTQQTGIGATFTKIDQFTSPIIREKNMTISGVNNNVTVNVTGLFHISCNLSFTGSANVTYEVSIFKNGTKIDHITNVRKLGTGGDVGAISFAGTDSITASDVIDMRVSADSEGNNFRLVRANLILNKVR